MTSKFFFFISFEFSFQSRRISCPLKAEKQRSSWFSALIDIHNRHSSQLRTFNAFICVCNKKGEKNRFCRFQKYILTLGSVRSVCSAATMCTKNAFQFPYWEAFDFNSLALQSADDKCKIGFLTLFRERSEKSETKYWSGGIAGILKSPCGNFG